MPFERAVLVTRKTRMEELIARFNTRAQARFYIEHSGGDFNDYEAEHEAYLLAADTVRRDLERSVKLQVVDRSFLPTFLFSSDTVIVTLGQDGLVANTAKYVHGLPIVAINPDPARFDGVLLPFQPRQARMVVEGVLTEKFKSSAVTMARAELNDGQTLLAFNDLFVGARSHVSARYAIDFEKKQEAHSSSGVIVSTGAGSTGWMSSVFNMTTELSEFLGQSPLSKPLSMSWAEERLLFVVREPFASKHSSASIVVGWIRDGSLLRLESHMPTGGVIFSDGIEADFLSFNSGAEATIRVAPEKAQLVTAA